MPYAEFTATAVDERPHDNALRSWASEIDPGWIDYNGHMTEWMYYKVLCDAGENFLRAAEFTEEYRLQGYSFFSVAGHLRNLKECRVGARLAVRTEMIGFDDVRLQVYQYVVDEDRDITVATGEHLMLHVDTNLRKRTAMPAVMQARLAAALARWVPARRPLGLGAAI